MLRQSKPDSLLDIVEKSTTLSMLTMADVTTCRPFRVQLISRFRTDNCRSSSNTLENPFRSAVSRSSLARNALSTPLTGDLLECRLENCRKHCRFGSRRKFREIATSLSEFVKAVSDSRGSPDVTPKKTDVDNTKHLPQRKEYRQALPDSHIVRTSQQPLCKGAKIGKSSCLNASEYRLAQVLQHSSQKEPF